MAARAVGRDARVIEAGRPPRDRRVTGAALGCRGDVAGALARRYRAVVAGSARTDGVGVIEPQHRRPGGRRVAGLAGIAGLHVIRRLAGRAAAVMTAHAVTGDARVIEAGGAPSGGVVACVAVERRDDMVG